MCIYFKVAALLIVAAASTGCKLQIVVPEGGQVETVSGDYMCQQTSTCELEVNDIFFDQTFVPKPEDGYYFVEWERVKGGFCGSYTGPCRLYTSLLSLNQNLMAILESDITFNLTPRFERYGKELNGVYPNGLTLYADQSPYFVSDLVDIAGNFTIEAGTQLVGPGTMKIRGDVDIRGSAENMVVFNINGSVNFSDDLDSLATKAVIKHTEFKSNVWASRNTKRTFLVEDSKFHSTQPVIFQSLETSATLRRNSFYGGLLFERNSAAVHVENNLFLTPTTDSFGLVIYDLQNTTLHALHNSFLCDGECFNIGNTPIVTAVDNYWGTDKSNEIDDKIRDRKDTLDAPIEVSYTPYLLSPHPLTPEADR